MSDHFDPIAFGEWLKTQMEFAAFTGLPNPEDPDKTVPVLVTQTKDGAKLLSVRAMIAEWRTRPERRSGTATMHDLESFISHVMRFMDRNSVVFADGSNPAAPRLLAVMDYHEAVNRMSRVPLEAAREMLTMFDAALEEGDAADPDAAALGRSPTMIAAMNAVAAVQEGLAAGDGGIVAGMTRVVFPSPSSNPRFGGHRTLYQFPLSDEWQVWFGQNGTKMNQGDFAEFLEDHIADVASPPDADEIERRITRARADGNSTVTAMDYARLMGGQFATPARLVELSRGLTIRQHQTAKQLVNVSSGEMSLEYTATNVDEQGAPLKIPNLFMIAVPVFKNGMVYEVVVRLRTRLDRGALTWTFEMYRPDAVFRHAFEGAAREARDATGLPLLFGTPEAV